MNEFNQEKFMGGLVYGTAIYIRKLYFFLSWPASFDLMKMISLADGFISFLYGKNVDIQNTDLNFCFELSPPRKTNYLISRSNNET